MEEILTTQVIALGPGGFAGAGRIMCNGLLSIARHGIPCMFIGPKTPFSLRHKKELPIQFRWRSIPVTSGAIGEGAAIGHSMVLFPIELADEVVKNAKAAAETAQRVVVWAHYLFPYGIAAQMAKSILTSAGIEIELWLNPAGSDIWEVGRQFEDVTISLLNDPMVDRIVTYSDQFAAEIADIYKVERSIDVVKPSVEDEYYALSTIDRAAARRRLGFPEKEFIISCHSNMRPVKAPQDVVMVARRAASQLLERPSSLLLAGPVRDVESSCDGMSIRRLGVVRQMWELLQIVDVELNLSRHDSFNLSLAEAMACGVPVVTTDIVGISDDVVDARAGVAVPLERRIVNDPRATYDAAVRGIVTFGSLESVRLAAGMAGAQYSKKQFSNQAYWKRISVLL
ncbi:glycosyltransferase [Amycolatopsis umgeniensis]|uniref:Glycosyltransferase involved in cell wall biosynthesis n=1 Tax=Amycolatopsis umgeniensis TaxID=336628 RepID=A0A841AVP8_9PSEU|nr:glycosyltransferase [Amycolatopsis umgeniensis]MBB5852969.1 glycosyltransferase involved in cell wall biosynthesis [Amycolatopsis umgeniensis]